MIIHKSNIKDITRIRITHLKNVNATMHPVSNSETAHYKDRLKLIFHQVHFRSFLHIQNEQKIPISRAGFMK